MARTALPSFHYLIMEWVDGTQIEPEEWDKLNIEIQHKLCYKIGLQVQKLRSIQQPSNSRYYGRINNQSFPPEFYHLGGNRRNELAGPFHTYKSFLERLFISSKWSTVSRIMLNDPDAENIPPAARFISSIWLEQFNYKEEICEPKLTHNDIKLRNMIFVKPPKYDERKIEDLDVVLIDWEFLAWQPAWQEILNLHTDFAGYSDRNSGANSMALLGLAKAIKPFPYSEALVGLTMLGDMGVQ